MFTMPLLKKISKKSFENPKVLQNAAVKGRQPAIRPEFASIGGAQS
jgi:hypothetical protein